MFYRKILQKEDFVRFWHNIGTIFLLILDWRLSLLMLNFILQGLAASMTGFDVPCMFRLSSPGIKFCEHWMFFCMRDLLVTPVWFGTTTN